MQTSAERERIHGKRNHPGEKGAPEVVRCKMSAASLLGNAKYQAEQQAGAQSEDREPATALISDEV